MTDALRIHYCLDKPRDDRKCRARCGHWTTHFTDEHALVTCKACRKLLALPPHSSKPTAMTKLSSILPLALILLSACDTPDDPTGSTSSASSTGDSPTEDALSTSSGEADGSTGSSGPDVAPEECSGLPCTFDEAGLHGCSAGLQCVPHPDTGDHFCVAPCVSPGVCDGPAIDCNAEPVKGECLPDADGVPSCFAR